PRFSGEKNLVFARSGGAADREHELLASPEDAQIEAVLDLVRDDPQARPRAQPRDVGAREERLEQIVPGIEDRVGPRGDRDAADLVARSLRDDREVEPRKRVRFDVPLEPVGGGERSLPNPERRSVQDGAFPSRDPTRIVAFAQNAGRPAKRKRRERALPE